MREKIVPIEVTPEMMKMLEICKKNKSINPELYTKYDVKRGLRDINGKGVLAGLTEIGEIHAYDTLSDGSSKPCDGKLYYHGYDVEDLIKGFIRDKRFGFEEVTYLLLFGGERGERNAAGNGKNACGGDKGAAFHSECPFRV